MQEKKQKIRYVFKREQKTDKVVADVTSVGRLFHKRLPATGKAWSPTVKSKEKSYLNATDELMKQLSINISSCSFVPMVQRNGTG